MESIINLQLFINVYQSLLIIPSLLTSSDFLRRSLMKQQMKDLKDKGENSIAEESVPAMVTYLHLSSQPMG